MKYYTAPTEIKAIGDAGSFEGYASTFNNVDQGGDVILPGAFKEFKFTRDGQVKLLYQHSTRDPIGKATVRQDTKGLEFKGQLLLDVPAARTCYSLLKAEIIDETSIGFDVLPGGEKVRDDGVRELSKLKLWEISPVTFAMNEQARVSAVKAADILTNPRALEDFLREAGGLSHSQAKALVAKGWRALQPTREESPAKLTATQVLAAIRASAAAA